MLTVYTIYRPSSEVMLAVFNEIQAVNSVFAAASLPVSVNARGTYLNQVYMGMFRPDADGHPRWRGNLIAGSLADDRGHYFKNAGTAASRFLNTLITGDPLETICARVGRWQEDGRRKGRIVGAILDWAFSKGHCGRSRERYLELFHANRN